ncbi:hypothetical protein D3C87_396090 [compost metagenome]
MFSINPEFDIQSMKISILLIFLFLGLQRSNAQFDTLTHFNQVIRDMIVFDNKLFIGGNFTNNQDSIHCYWSAYYNGSSIIRHTNLIGGGGPREFAVFNNELYAVGDWGFTFDPNIGVAKWNGSTWQQAGGSNSNHWSILADENYLYVATPGGVIRRKTASGSFLPFKDLSTTGNVSIFKMISYQGKLCVMGNFTELEGVPVRNIALWNGSTWEALGTGVGSNVTEAVVYQNELYIAGSFNEAGGVTAKNIAKWNGTSWSDVGMSITGTSWNGIRALVPCGNLLFALGDFDEIGNQAADDIASWDGQQWTTYNFTHPESILNTGVEYNGRLYFGTFDFTRSNVYGYSGNFLSLDESETTSLSIYPNPSNGIFRLSDDYKESSYEVLNTTGQVILSGNNSVIDLSGQESGIYLLRFQGRHSEMLRLIKE